MRITYVTENFKPQINSVALNAARAVRHLRAAGHQVELLRPRQPGEASSDTAEELRTPGCRLPLFRSGQVHFGLASAAALQRRWQLSGLPDLVHVATAGPLAWAALAAARASGVATSAELRFKLHAGAGRQHGAAVTLMRAYLKRLHRMADTSFVATQELAGHLAAQGFQNLQLLGGGVESAAFSPQWRDCWLRHDWRAADDHPVLLYVGRLAADKNAELALQAYEHLRQDHRSLRMVVVGDGPLRRHLQAGYPRVRFAGWQTGTELARHYASADVCLFPSLSTNFGNVTLEAMASGLVLVAFDTAAARVHVVDGETGFLASPLAGPASADGFIETTRRALAASAVDHPLRQRARQAALRADWHGVLCSFEARLQHLSKHAPAVQPHAALA